MKILYPDFPEPDGNSLISPYPDLESSGVFVLQAEFFWNGCNLFQSIYFHPDGCAIFQNYLPPRFTYVTQEPPLLETLNQFIKRADNYDPGTHGRKGFN